jgi:psiF repeat-containing protein
MRKIALAICLMFACSPFALAQDKKDTKKEPSAAQKKQQERMRDCNEQAGAKKMEGDARKKFMSACLKGGSDKKGEKMSAQQSRMKDCNKQASDKKMKGDDRKKFMSACLKG